MVAGAFCFIAVVAWCIYMGIQSFLGDIYKARYERKRSEALENNAKRREAWLGAVTDEKLEAELEGKVLNKDDDITREMETYWGEYFEGESFPGYPFFQEDILRILMINRGCLIKKDAETGIRASGCEYMIKNKSADELYERRVRFLEKIDERLKERGINEKMLLQTDKSSGKYIRLRGDRKCYGGYVVWRPVVDAFNLPDRMLAYIGENIWGQKIPPSS